MHRRLIFRSVFPVFIVLVVLLVQASAQEFRATITGVVNDSSKAVIRGATVTVRNLDTNEVITVKTDRAGVYAVPYLHPGDRLEVSATATGFQTNTYPPVVLSVSQVQTANFTLQVGTASEQVTVNSQSYDVGLDTEKADRGTIVDNATLTQMPLNGRNALSLLDYIPGITNENGAGQTGVGIGMGGFTGYTVNGTQTGSLDFTIDGMSNNALPWYLEKTPSVIPSIDALQEMKVTTSPYDAEQGHTAAGGISMELKSGTNDIHGAVWEFAKRTFLDANTWINDYYDTGRADHTEDQYGFEVDGPVYIPHLYNGRNKTFFMFNFEKYKQTLPYTAYYDVPDASWLQGDFTNFYDQEATPKLMAVFDPATATTSNPTRQIFQNSAGKQNMVDPSRFNPISLSVLTMVANAAPPISQRFVNEPVWEQTWLDLSPTITSSTNIILKIDQILGSKDHLTGSWIRQYDPSSWLGTPAGVPWEQGSAYTEYHANYGLDWVHTISSNVLTDVHVSYQRYWNSDGPTQQNLNFDPTTLGIPASQLGPLKKGFPIFTINTAQGVSAQGNGYGSFMGISRDFYKFPSDTYSFAPKITWLKGKQDIRIGLDMRLSHASNPFQGNNSISYSSDGQATSQDWANNNTSNFGPDSPWSGKGSGNAVLDMLIGQPNSVAVTNQIFPYYTWRYYAPWVQDDWKITPTLTLNLGFRYDFNMPVTVRNGYLNTGFDLNAVNPISVPGNLGTLKGGFLFPSTTHTNSEWSTDWTQWQPRLGFAWQPRSGTVLRGGAGRTIINSADTPDATGFSYPPVYNNSPDGGRTYFADNMTTPFPGGVPAIPGASQGLLTNVGQSISFANPHLRMSSVINGSLGLEQAVPHNGKFEISYVMTRGYDLTTQGGTHFSDDTVNSNRALYKSCNDGLALSDAANPYPSLNCTQLVTNPFYGVPGVTGSLYSNQQTSAYQLSRPYPEFGSITQTLKNWGHTWYNSVQSTYQQRVGFAQINGSWTWSKTMQSGGFQDLFYLIPTRSIASTDRQNRLTVTGIVNIPVGRGMQYYGNMNRVLDWAIGGWEFGSDAFWESGTPVSLPTGYNIVGNIRSNMPKHSSFYVIDEGMNPCYQSWSGPYIDSNGVKQPGSFSQPWTATSYSCPAGDGVAWQQVTGSYGEKTTQPYSDMFRGPDAWQDDINLSKNFKFTRRISMQLRLELFNVFNHPNWNGQVDTTPSDADFGTVNKSASYGQSNAPRRGQLGAKVTW